MRIGEFDGDHEQCPICAGELHWRAGDREWHCSKCGIDFELVDEPCPIETRLVYLCLNCGETGFLPVYLMETHRLQPDHCYCGNCNSPSPMLVHEISGV